MSVSVLTRLSYRFLILPLRVKIRKVVNTGPDDMAMEALTNGTYELFVHLAILFNLFINFSYFTNSFMQSIIVPLVKNKAGDLSDLTNYRAIVIFGDCRESAF